MKQVISLFILFFAVSVAVFAQNAETPCPNIEVNGGGVVRSGESMHFTVSITGLPDTANLKYEWEISNGTISSGLETPVITVDTTGLSKTGITAKVKVTGLPENCASTASETGTASPIVDFFPFDEFGSFSDNDALARINNLYVELGNNTNAQGYIFNYGTAKETAAREKQVQRAIKRLKLDKSRVTIINGGANPRGKGVWTKIWLMPKGTDMSPFEI